MRWLAGAKRSPIGIDVSGRFINAVQLGRRKSRWCVEAAVSVLRRDPTMPVDVEELGRLASMLYRQGFRGCDVVIAVPGERLITSVLELPDRPTRVDRRQQARDQLASVHKCPPAALEVACWDLPRPGRPQGTTSVIAVACKQEEANGIIDLFEGAGMGVRALDVASWAVARACAPALKDSRGMAALLNVGWGAAELVVVAEGIVAYERVLAEHGMNRLHSRLANKLDLDGDVTDHLLHEIGLRCDLPEAEAQSDLLTSVRRYLSDHLDRMASELTRSLTYASQEYAGRDLDRVLVHGEGAVVPGLTEHLSSQLGLEVKTLVPRDVADCRTLPAQGGLGVLMTALGLAQHAGD